MADLLVVDDDVDVADMLADMLRGVGHTARVARDGAEGLSRLEERLPDAVLLDVEMPVLGGPEMAMHMFVHDCGQENIPIVLQSGVKDLARVAAVVRTPYFVSKPYTFDELRVVLDRALQERVVPHPAVR